MGGHTKIVKTMRKRGAMGTVFSAALGVGSNATFAINAVTGFNITEAKVQTCAGLAAHVFASSVSQIIAGATMGALLIISIVRLGTRRSGRAGAIGNVGDLPLFGPSEAKAVPEGLIVALSVGWIAVMAAIVINGVTGLSLYSEFSDEVKCQTGFPEDVTRLSDHITASNWVQLIAASVYLVLLGVSALASAFN